MRHAAIVLGVFLLAACATRQDVAVADHQECLSLGFQQGTEAYGDCRLRLREIRARERQTMAIDQARFNHPFGWAPWYPSRYYW